MEKVENSAIDVVYIYDSAVGELEKEVTCAICHEYYTDPKVLPCSHYYCKQCIHRLILKTATNKPFSCPECRQGTTLPLGGVDHLPTAFFINRMKGVHSKLERAHGKVEAECEGCSGGKAEAFCRQCAQFICAGCVVAHQKLRVFTGHKTVTLDELKEGGAKDIVMQDSTLPICQEHEEMMKIYCFDCNCLICRDCTISDHKDHNHRFIRKCASEMKEKLHQQLGPLKKMKVIMSQAVEVIKTTESEVKEDRDAVIKETNKSFEKLHKVIEKHKQKILGKVPRKAASKLDNLSDQRESLSTECAVVQSVIEYTERCLKHATDSEFVEMHRDLQSRIDRETRERNLEPVEEVDIGVRTNCVEDLQKFCQTKIDIIRLAVDPTKCAVIFEGKDLFQVNKPVATSLKLIKKLSNNRPTKQGYDFQCQLKSLCNGSIIKCNVDLIKGNEYRIHYTPTIRGRHKLIVTANGEKVAGSPFPVFVSIHPTQLDNYIKHIPVMQTKYRGGNISWSMSNGTDSQSVATNSAGEIIVSKESYGMKIMDKNGSLVLDDDSIGNPCCVAVDDADNIYVTDKTNHKIWKLNQKLKILNVIVDDQLDPYGVAVVKNEVMVCDNKNSRICVFTKQLELVRKIGLPGKGPGRFNNLTDISSDCHGNLYICDTGNSRIQVLGNGGEYLHSFGCKPNTRKISVAGQFIYVAHELTTQGYQSVSVCDKEGRCVKSLPIPHQSLSGLCVDKDGFLYVYSGDRVYVY